MGDTCSDAGDYRADVLSTHKAFFAAQAFDELSFPTGNCHVGRNRVERTSSDRQKRKDIVA